VCVWRGQREIVYDAYTSASSIGIEREDGLIPSRGAVNRFEVYDRVLGNRAAILTPKESCVTSCLLVSVLHREASKSYSMHRVAS